MKVGRYRQLIELMKLCKYQRSRSFLDLWPKVIYSGKYKLAFLRNHWAILTKFCMEAFRYMEMKICKHDAGHMTKMAAMPIYAW